MAIVPSNISRRVSHSAPVVETDPDQTPNATKVPMERRERPGRWSRAPTESCSGHGRDEATTRTPTASTAPATPSRRAGRSAARDHEV
jgi:hypothetical protein